MIVQHWFTHRVAVLTAFILLIGLIVIGPNSLISHVLSNAGLLALDRSLVQYGVLDRPERADPDLVNADRWLTTATEFDAANQGAWRGLGLSATARGDRSQAVISFRKAHLGANDLIVWGNDAATANQLQALEWYALATQTSPEQSDAYAQSAILYEQMSQTDSALEAYKSALDHASFTSIEIEKQAWYRFGLLIESKSSASDLVALYERAVAALPEDAYLHASLGRALYRATGHSAEALPELQRAIQIDPQALSPYLFQADIFLQENQPTHALQTAKQALAVSPHSAEALIYIGRAYLATRQFDQARSSIANALEIDPANASAHFWLGQVALTNHELSTAAQQFRVATEIAPDVFSYWYYLGEALRLSGSIESARDAYVRAQKIAPESPLPPKRLLEIANQ